MNIAIRKILPLLFFGAILALAIFCSTITNQSGRLAQQLEREQLKSEALLAEKLSIEKALVKTTRKLNSMKITQADLGYRIMTRNRQLTNMSERNHDLKLKFDSLKTTHQQSLDSLAGLEKAIGLVALENSYELKRLRNLVDSLSMQRTDLNSQLESSRSHSVFFSFVKASSGCSGPLTVQARKTKCFTARFEIPASLVGFRFNMYGPDGLLESGNSDRFTQTVLFDESMIASSHNVIRAENPRKKIEIVFQPAHKLKPGEYSFSILDGREVLGSAAIELR
jgi:hypothetical protein